MDPLADRKMLETAELDDGILEYSATQHASL
jgi:hypothetical protein